METVAAGIAIAGGVASIASNLAELYDNLSTNASDRELAHRELSAHADLMNAQVHTARVEGLAAVGAEFVSVLPSLVDCVNGLRASQVQNKHLKVKAELEQMNGMLQLLYNTAQLQNALHPKDKNKKKKGKLNKLKKLFCCCILQK
jgi:hypothetical protein